MYHSDMGALMAENESLRDEVRELEGKNKRLNDKKKVLTLNKNKLMEFIWEYKLPILFFLFVIGFFSIWTYVAVKSDRENEMWKNVADGICRDASMLRGADYYATGCNTSGEQCICTMKFGKMLIDSKVMYEIPVLAIENAMKKKK